MMMLRWIEFMLYVAATSSTLMLILYGCFVRWWKSWFGCGFILAVFSVWQLEVRGCLILWLGPNYRWNEWVLLIGITGAAVAMTIGWVGVAVYLLRQWRKNRRPGTSVVTAEQPDDGVLTPPRH